MTTGLAFTWTPVLAEGGIGSIMPLVVLLFFIISIVRAIRQAQQAKDVHKASGDETEEEARAREIRERLRRVIAERRGEAPPMAGETRRPPAEPATPPPPATIPPLVRRVPPLDPFGGPVPRTIGELQRRFARTEPKPAPQEPVRAEPMRAERTEPARRERNSTPASSVALPAAISMSEISSAPGMGRAGSVTQAEAARRLEARKRVLEDLSDPQSLRRAIVLREILGTPVGLRR